MNHQLTRKRADQLRATPLPAVLRIWGATPDPRDPHKWHTSQGIISLTGAKFMNWNRGVGGGGAIDLVIHLSNLGFKEALDWERLFGLGNIILTTTDNANPTVTIAAVREASALRDQIRLHVEKCRQRKGVRITELE